MGIPFWNLLTAFWAPTDGVGYASAVTGSNCSSNTRIKNTDNTFFFMFKLLPNV